MQRRNNGLNAPSGAGCFLTDWGPLGCRSEVRLNAPSGAGCFLTPKLRRRGGEYLSLNASSGAGCFLTLAGCCSCLGGCTSLNAPSGAGCFLTKLERLLNDIPDLVLMHLLVLGAF